MSEIPGSKPRKLIRKTNLSNPSLISNNIISLWDPQNMKNDKLQRQRHQRSISSGRSPQINPLIHRNNSQSIYNNIDSLKQAQQSFIKKKISHPALPLQNNINSLKIHQNINKNTQYSSSLGLSNLSYLKQFNYIDFKSIRSKQRHGYDIINCMPAMNK